MRNQPLAVVIALSLLAFCPFGARAETVTGYSNGSSYLHAGPGGDFPVVAHIPPGADLAVMGCTQGYIWCDVSWNGNRGWISARFLDSIFNDEHVSIREVHVPVVVFEQGSYWKNFYSGYSFYNDGARVRRPAETPAEVRIQRYTGVDE